VTARRRLAAALAVVALATALGACGRRDAPRAPEGREGEYTYPRFYPAPATVLPATAGGAGDEVEVEVDTEPEEDIRKLSPIPPSDSRTTTTTYGPSPE
jgi:hypothetical protein